MDEGACSRRCGDTLIDVLVTFIFIDLIEMNLRYFCCNMYFNYTTTLINHAVISKDDLLNPSVVSATSLLL